MSDRKGNSVQALDKALTMLKRRSFVQQDERSRRFRLGWALVHLGKAATRACDLVAIARPHLETLARQTGGTANLVLPDGRRVVYIDQVVSRSIIRGVPSVDSRLGLHCTAAGKVLLGFRAQEEIRQTLRGLRLRRMTPKTITDPAKLRRELNRVGLQGFAVDAEEIELGGCCVAAPVYGKEGRVLAAVSIMGPTRRVNPDSIPRLAKTVRVAAREISRALGGEAGGSLHQGFTS